MIKTISKRGRKKSSGKIFANALKSVKSVSDMSPHPIDCHVGNRLKIARTFAGISQEKLAEAVGLTFQQLQKYERGSNRISSSRLWEFSTLLNVDIHWFFDRIELEEFNPQKVAEEQEAFEKDNQFSYHYLNKKETLDLIRVWYSIKDNKTREKMLSLLKTMSSS